MICKNALIEKIYNVGNKYKSPAWTTAMLQKANWFIASVNNTFFGKLITYDEAISCIEINRPCTVYVRNYPITILDKYGIDVKLVNDLTEEERTKIAEVLYTCNKIKSPNKRHTSSELKDMLVKETGVELTLNQFKHFMILLKFMSTPVSEKDKLSAIEYYYNISERSEFIQKFR